MSDVSARALASAEEGLGVFASGTSRARRPVSALRADTAYPVEAKVEVTPRGIGGYWYHDGKAHHIVLSETLQTMSPGLGIADQIALGLTVLRHEAWHGRKSPRTPRIIEDALKRHRVPTYLWNFFEDARIEAAARDAEGKPFEWVKLLGGTPGMDPIVEHPVQWFRNISLVNGGDPTAHGFRWKGDVCTTYRGKIWATQDLVADFHARVRETGDEVRATWPLLAEWLEAFGGYAEPPITLTLVIESRVPGDPKGKGQGQTDAEVEAEGRGSKGKKPGKPKPEKGDGDEEADGPTKAGTGKNGTPSPHDPVDDEPVDDDEPIDMAKVEPPPKDQTWVRHGRHQQTLTSEEERDLSFYSAGYQSTDISHAPRLAAKLARMVGHRDPSRVKATTSGPRLHLGNVISGMPEAFRVASTRSGKRRVCVVMDMSGSMSTDFAYHGGAFLAAMLILHQRGTLLADLWLTGSGRCARVPGHTPPARVTGLYAGCGCESVDATLKTIRADVMAADTVLIYTDGNLTDGDVQAGAWRGKGVDLIGISTAGVSEANQAQHIAKLTEHFAKAIVAPDGDQLASKLMQYILTRP